MQTVPNHRHLAASAFALAFLACPASHAARPLGVDDANVVDLGTGHVEFWYSRLPGNVNTWTLAPAYGPVEGIEAGVALTLDTTNNLRVSSAQVKWRITDSKKSGCNLGVVVGMSQPNDGTGNTPYLNGLTTCNGHAGSLHVNLGGNRGPYGPTLGTWGVAFEREFDALTAHVEVFGQEQSSPTFQFGGRTMLLKRLQLDGTLGSNSGQAVFTLGLKFFY